MNGRRGRGRQTGWLVVALVSALLAAGLTWAVSEQPREEFCEAWGIISGRQVISIDEISLLSGEPISAREPCMGDDLWHFAADDLKGVDGVLFDNCEISWVGGGRSTAAAEGIDCTPAPPVPVPSDDYPVSDPN